MDFKLASLLYDTKEKLNMKDEDVKELAKKVSTMSYLNAKNYIENNNTKKKPSKKNRIILGGIELTKTEYNKLVKLAEEEGMTPEEYATKRIASSIKWRYWAKKKEKKKGGKNK